MKKALKVLSLILAINIFANSQSTLFSVNPQPNQNVNPEQVDDPNVSPEAPIMNQENQIVNPEDQGEEPENQNMNPEPVKDQDEKPEPVDNQLKNDQPVKNQNVNPETQKKNNWKRNILTATGLSGLAYYLYCHTNSINLISDNRYLVMATSAVGLVGFLYCLRNNNKQPKKTIEEIRKQLKRDTSKKLFQEWTLLIRNKKIMSKADVEKLKELIPLYISVIHLDFHKPA